MKVRNALGAIAAASAVLIMVGGGSLATAIGASASSSSNASIIAQAEKAPTQISVTTPLPKAPPKGKTVVWMDGQLANSIPDSSAQAAAKTLGWTMTVVPWNWTNAASSMDEAIAMKPNYIMVTTGPVAAALAPQLEAAHQAGIDVLNCYGPAPGTGNPSKVGFVTNCGQQVPSAQPNVLRPVIAWAARHSGGKANILNVNVPAYPALVARAKVLKKLVPQMCPHCTLQTLNVSPQDFASGASLQEMVTYLQANPKIDYLYPAEPDLTVGLSTALQSAGLANKVTVFGNGWSKAIAQSMVAGSQQAWIPYPGPYYAWLMFDSAARLSEGLPVGSISRAADINSPVYLVATAAAAQPLQNNVGWPGPAGFEQKFKALWKVG